MLTVLKVTKIWIEHIDKIEVQEMMPLESVDYSEKSISIWTKEGERYEISLHADTPSQLEFRKPSEGDWLTPKVYKGTSVHEEEP
jgi:hypothetical protein